MTLASSPGFRHALLLLSCQPITMQQPASEVPATETETSTCKDKIRFLLLEGINPSAVAVIHAAGYTQIESIAGAVSGEALESKLRGVHFLGIRSRTQLTQSVLAHADRLAAVGCFCIGTNQVDLAAARDLGIAVFNAPFSNTPIGGRDRVGRRHPADGGHP